MFNPQSFYDVLRPMYIASKIIGLAPFETRSYKPSKFWMFYGTALSIALNLYIGSSFSIDLTMGFIPKVTATLDILLTQISLTAGILLDSLFVNKMLRIMEEIDRFDLQIDFAVDLNREYRKNAIYILLALLACSCYVLISFALTVMVATTTNLLGGGIAYVVPIMINTLVDFHFCVYVLCLKRRFGWLNGVVSDFAQNFDKTLQDYREIFSLSLGVHTRRPASHMVATELLQDQASHVIDLVKNKHYKLCSIAHDLNRTYSLRLLLIIVQSFITVVASVFYIGRHVFFNDDVLGDYIAYAVIQMNLAAMQVVCLVVVCSSATAQAKNTAILIHNALAFDWNGKPMKTFQSEIKLFSLQLLHHNLQFTACNLFVINESLLFSILGVIGTYLIIIIQFEIAAGRNYQ